MVDVDPRGLDAKGLGDLGSRVCSVLYALTGKHFSLDDIEVDDLREFNVDSSDPELTHLLHLSGIKSGLSYSRLLESYLRIYEKTEGTVRVESGGKNAFELMRTLRTPVAVLESQARMPDQILSALNDTRDRINQQVDVLSKGMANVLQQQQRDHELTTHLASVFTSLVEKLDTLVGQLQSDRESRERETANLRDTVEILLTEREIAKRLAETEKQT